MRPSQSHTNLKSIALGAWSIFAMSASAVGPTSTPTMQVYHECSESIYCRYFALTGRSTSWELVPSRKVTTYDYPTEKYNATVWCSNAPNNDAYSWMKLSLDGASTDIPAGSVGYSSGSYGISGTQTQSSLQQGGFQIGPVGGVTQDASADACQTLRCAPGSSECSQQSSTCNQGSTIRWSMCTGGSQNNFTVTSRASRSVRAARFVA